MKGSLSLHREYFWRSGFISYCNKYSTVVYQPRQLLCRRPHTISPPPAEYSPRVGPGCYRSVSQSHRRVCIHRTLQTTSCCITVPNKSDSTITREILLLPAAPVIEVQERALAIPFKSGKLDSRFPPTPIQKRTRT